MIEHLQNTLPNDIPTGYIVAGAGIAILISVIIAIFFSWTCYRTLSCIPKEKQTVPAWVCWLMIIPLLGFIIQWIMLPFAIPNSIKQAYPDNADVMKAAKTLFGIGLAFVILATISVIPVIGLVGIASFILFIIYWVKVADIRKYLA